MPGIAPSLVDSVRSASRKMVRELGFMQSTLAATDYPPSAVHAILEIGRQQSLTAAQLADILNLDKSSVSRMVRKLVEADEVQESASGADGRAKTLTLTPQGQRTWAAVEAFGRQQVAAALAPLAKAQHSVVRDGLVAYAQALEALRLGPVASTAEQTRIARGYQPGVIGRVAQMHADYYAHNFGFGQFFESQVATGMAEFTARLDCPHNALWTAVQAGRTVGSIAIDGEDLGGEIAHLRWFIVDDSQRGSGVGRALLQQALAFCDQQGRAAVHLWTFQGLDAARRLYESEGFVLAQEQPGSQWGTELVEQRFVRLREAAPTV
ncbi:helix-turn-helix domain-containing GNAT family N-acetyltransferase [Rhodoferax sp.]|uniref:bifunctional helix-turn-helix transcriptional regulator/GNAT family N-acetyltransferase n=1 Tax=Rhodoferax sp. TaxID=50421 RepID=UPI0025F1AA3B|nr:helix-turn-helix domain-containing GNAT family N-acetyltransferase [Rhodoferax sp.]